MQESRQPSDSPWAGHEKKPYEGSCLGWELLSGAPLETARKFVQKMRLCGPPIAINCWRLSQFESMAMWRLHGDEVAVQTTFGRLVQSLAECPCDIKVGQVKYFMPAKEHFDPNDPLTVFVPYLHKHNGFEYERELRAIIWDAGDMPREADGSVLAPVDLDTLMENVYVSPSSNPDLRNIVEEATRAQGVKTQVLQSELKRVPLY